MGAWWVFRRTSSQHVFGFAGRLRLMHKSSTRVGHLILASHASCPGPGSSGFGFHTADKAELGYILSGLAWGQGFATETVNALVTVAASFGLLELDAHVHPRMRRLFAFCKSVDSRRMGLQFRRGSPTRGTLGRSTRFGSGARSDNAALSHK